ncbi:MAG: hypothetical protein WDM76_03715 [Limisphaerales bacterium]
MKHSQLIKKLIAACMIALPTLAFNAHSATRSIVWDPAHNPATAYRWTEGESWHSFIFAGGDEWGVVPDTVDYIATFNVNPAPICILDTLVQPGHVVVGDNGPGYLVITNGGSLIVTNNDWVGIGFVNSTAGYMEITAGGTLFVHDNFWIGFEPSGVGTFTMKGGTATIEGMTGLGWNGGDRRNAHQWWHLKSLHLA